VGMDIEQKLIEIVNTTENTYLVYKKIASKLLIHDLEYLNKTLEELSNQQLIDKYLQEEKEDGSFYYRYKKGVDDRFIKKIGGNKDSYDNWCTIKWVDRKREELSELKNKLVETDKLYPTLKVDLLPLKLILIFKLLKDNKWIHKEILKKDFDTAFSGKETSIKPQIIFLKNKQHLAYLIEKLNLKKGSYSHIIETSEIFITKDNKPFKEIRKTKYKETDDIKKIDKKINEIINN